MDNEIYFSMCSPARDLSADYHAVRNRTFLITTTSALNSSVVVGPLDGR
jgi:hypothetical protein